MPRKVLGRKKYILINFVLKITIVIICYSLMKLLSNMLSLTMHLVLNGIKNTRFVQCPLDHFCPLERRDLRIYFFYKLNLIGKC